MRRPANRACEALSHRYLLDTHILLWWLHAPRKLSPEQLRVLRKAVSRGELLAYCATILMEIAVAHGAGNRKGPSIAEQILQKLECETAIVVLPITFEVARELASLGPALPDPNDRLIVATARVHRPTLITSDERIIKSKLVPVVS